MDITFSPKEFFTKDIIKQLHSDKSLWALLISNALVIIWALIENWSVSVLMWIYWCQSVTIGFFWFLKILSLKDFSTKGMDPPSPATTLTKIQIAFFFLAHYGIFHVAYGGFLIDGNKPENFQTIICFGILFFAYQCFSFFYNKKWLTKGKPNIGSMMFFPYFRIIPMHLTIIIGGFLTQYQAPFSHRIMLLFFLILKIVADSASHAAERRGFG
ncbi:MAG: DUF6498-containing protein [Planctomycetota bacterium]|jgi:hypothetical protein